RVMASHQRQAGTCWTRLAYAGVPPRRTIARFRRGKYKSAFACGPSRETPSGPFCARSIPIGMKSKFSARWREGCPMAPFELLLIVSLPQDRSRGGIDYIVWATAFARRVLQLVIHVPAIGLQRQANGIRRKVAVGI